MKDSPRLISYNEYDSYLKNGLNQAAIETVKHTGKPITWFSGWKEPTVNIGRDQDPREVCNLEEMNKDNVVLVRRQGGGGAVYLSPGNEISWSLVTPAQRRPETIEETHRAVSQTIIEALNEVGIEARHEPPNDVVTENGKISGGTLRQQDGVVYTGSTLLYDVDVDEMFTYLTPSKEKYEEKGYRDVQCRVDAIYNHTTKEFEDVVDIIQSSVIEEYDCEVSSWTDEELRKARQHADKYSEASWLFNE
jgi:lipoate-protein ligase A